MPAMPETAPQPLTYAPRPPWHRRKRWRRGKLVVAVLLITVAGWYWLQPWRRVQIVYWQRRCMKMTPPADGQIEIRDPGKMAALMNNPDYIRGPGPAASKTYWHPEAWRRFRSWCMPTESWRSWNGTVVFLGTRCAPGGSPRLVMVSNEGLFFFSGRQQGHNLHVTVIRPATLWREPESHANMVAIPWDFLGVQLSAGRADPNDASHIVVPCTVYDLVPQPSLPRAGQIDLYLQTDDTLRAGPLPEP